MKHMIFAVIFTIKCLIPVAVDAQLRLPAILSSSMVIQQNDSVALWGWAGPAEKVFVTTSWNNQTDSTMSGNGATWKLKVKTPSAGGPYSISISSRNTIKLDDVMVGEVWICSGQSNMEWSANNGVKDVLHELPTSYNPSIRLFHVPKTTSVYPQDDVKAEWAVCDSNSLKGFSAVGYFFGKKLNTSLHVPIGIINSSWGGTPAETWAPAETITNDDSLKEAAGKLITYDYWPSAPGLAYNGMIAPLRNFNIAGAIWYQGEANVKTNTTYERLLTRMIDSWRSEWNKNLPFYYVQIAPYKYEDSAVGALLQEAQTRAMSHPNTGMIVITDLIDSVTNIHPSMKREVGNRLANWALADTYHQTGIAYKSPVFKSAEKKSGKLILSFDHAENGLMAKAGAIRGFYISDVSGKWFPAVAKIDKDKIIVSSKQVKDPASVRFGFENTLVGNVFSTEGLPLTPFRMDK